MDWLTILQNQCLVRIQLTYNVGTCVNSNFLLAQHWRDWNAVWQVWWLISMTLLTIIIKKYENRKIPVLTNCIKSASLWRQSSKVFRNWREKWQIRNENRRMVTITERNTITICQLSYFLYIYIYILLILSYTYYYQYLVFSENQ